MIHEVDLTSRSPRCSGHWGRSIWPSAFYQHSNAKCCIHLTDRCPQWCIHHKTLINANVVLARHRYPSKLLSTLTVDMAASNEVINVNNKIADSRYFAPPHSIEPLPHTIRWGLIGVGICGLASFISTLALFSLLLYRLFTWRTHYKTFLGYNQYVVLFMNLIFADLCQASAFVISFYWIAKDAILAPTVTCATQGFLLHFGDVASALFVLSIAVHTFTTAVLGIRVAYPIFNILLWLVWLIALILTVLGFAMHKQTYFVRAGAWCWVSDEYEAERLALHYVWLFFSEFGLLVIYLVTFFKLRQQTSQLFAEQRRASNELANQNTVDAVKRVTKLMMLYPFVYVLLTLPISACRMWSIAHDGHPVSDATQCIVGALLASCGWVDCLLYSLTRKRLIQETMGGAHISSHGSRNRSQHEHNSHMPDNDSSEQRQKSLDSGLHRNQLKTSLQRFAAAFIEVATFLGIWRRRRMEITRTTTIEIRSDSFDATSGKRMPPSCVWSEITSNAIKARKSRSERREERNVEDPVYERSPSPQRFADLGFARSGKVIGIPPPPPKPLTSKPPVRTRAVELQVLPHDKDKDTKLARQ
jgi:hypothetical protein